MDIFWDPWPEDLHCSEFPDDPSSCIGYYEAHEPPEKLGKILVCNHVVTVYEGCRLSANVLLVHIANNKDQDQTALLGAV